MPTGSEGWWALLIALVLAAWPVRGALFDPGKVLFAVDTATVQLPWSAVIGQPGRKPANPDLADQGMQFYPFYRWIVDSYRSGDPPTWCPLIYAGAPGFGNAQSGALDPQVWALVFLDAIGGKALFDWGLSLVAWLRFAVALLGAYLLARRLGLGRAPAVLAGVTFGFCGFQVLWLNHALGHVPPFLPWVLFFLEGIRGERAFLSASCASLALAGAILGGHLETAFYVGLAGGLWAVSIALTDRRAGALGLFALALGTACAAISLLPSYEYLELSAAKHVRELGASSARGAVDLLSLGLLLAIVGLAVMFARLLRREDRDAGRTGVWLPGALGLGLACGGAALLLARRGLGEGGMLAVVPDVLGKPGEGGPGYRGPGTYTELASAWIPFASLALAVAALWTPRSALRRRGLVVGLGLVAFLLSVHLPGLIELVRFVPVVGLGATVRFAPVAALMLGLLAGDALQSSTRPGRIAACCILLPLVGGVFAGGGHPALPSTVRTVAEEDELLGFVATPAREIDGRDSELEGWLAPEVTVDAARVRVEELDADGRPAGWWTSVPLDWYPTASERARATNPAAVAAAPPGARWFRTPLLVTKRFPDGNYRFTVELMRTGVEEPVATRLAAVSSIARARHVDPLTAGVLALVLALLLTGGVARLPWLVVVLAGVQAFHFAHGINPLVPREDVFPSTRTEEILSAELGVNRFFSESGVLPPDTGLVSGLRAVEGYDAMDVLAFNTYRDLLVPSGLNKLLAWQARGIDVTNPAFRALGVGMLVMAEPFEHPDWELVAAPEGSASPRRAETWLYRARTPMPRAFCVPEVITLDALGELYRRDPAAWDPLRVAALEDAWRPRKPFSRAVVGDPVITNASVRVSVELDGDGLLVLTEQSFPGWRVSVDGVEHELLTADLIFRAVGLEAGEHEVVFRYRPGSIRVGAWISVLALAAVGALATLGLRGGRAS